MLLDVCRCRVITTQALQRWNMGLNPREDGPKFRHAESRVPHVVAESDSDRDGTDAVGKTLF